MQESMSVCSSLPRAARLRAALSANDFSAIRRHVCELPVTATWGVQIQKSKVIGARHIQKTNLMDKSCKKEK